MKYELTRPSVFGDRFYDDFFAPVFRDNDEMTSWKPAVDIIERNEKYVIKADLPGVEEKDVAVELKDDILTIKGERHNSFEEEKDNVYRCERSYGSFTRSFNISGVSDDDIKAEFKNGTLTVELPRAEQKKVKKIAVKSS